MACPICGIRPAVNAGGTCGDSYCQEAAYYRNMARNARGGRMAAAERLAGEKTRVACERAERRVS